MIKSYSSNLWLFYGSSYFHLLGQYPCFQHIFRHFLYILPISTPRVGLWARFSSVIILMSGIILNLVFSAFLSKTTDSSSCWQQIFPPKMKNQFSGRFVDHPEASPGPIVFILCLLKSCWAQPLTSYFWNVEIYPDMIYLTSTIWLFDFFQKSLWTEANQVVNLL